MSYQWTRSARARSLTLAAALLAAFGVLSLFVARAEAVPLTGSANPLPGSSFEGGDANQEASSVLRTDWASPGVNPVSASPDPNANDNIFAGGAEGKENNPGNWNFATQDGGSTPGKNNILDAYTHTPVGSGDVFLDLAFTRGSDTGTTYMAFELNKRADLWNNGKVNIPCRTTGDIIVSYQVSGNSPDVILQKWTSTTSDAVSGCGKTGTLTDYTAVVDNVNAQGAVNAAPIQNYLASSYPWPGNVIPAKLFGEASLNLTSLLSGALGTPCFSFGSIWMHTRASTSDSSNLDDYIAPRPLLVRNCSASGTKFHDLDGDGVKDAGEPGLAGFRMWADYDNDGVRDAGEPFADTGANGDYVIANIQDPSGTYSIREELTAGGGTGGWTCSYPLTTGDGGAFPCAHTGINGATTPNVTGKDFGNYKPAVVKVEKQTVPDGAQGTFGFTSTIPGKAGFDLSDGGVESTSVAPGTYAATETAHADFDLSGIACTDGDSSGAGQTATFRAQSGETITCTFTNTRKTGQLTVRKVLDPANDTGKFDLKIGADLVVDDGGNLAQGSRTLPTGAGYTVSEEGGANTSLAKYTSQIECRDGEVIVKSGSGTSLAGVPVIEGHDVVCTFTNARRPGTIEVVKDLVPNGDGGTFDLRVGANVVKAGASDGDGGATNVAPGTYTVSEVGANGTPLAKYDAAIACKDGDKVVASGPGTSLGGVAVDSNQKIVCTITNQRRPGKLTVVKDLLPGTDGGRFDLRIGGDVVKAGAGDGDAGSKELAPGDYDVAELAADGTSLAKYDASIACDNGQSGNGSSLAGVHVDSNDDITCTITNTRRKGSITVIKDLVPANDGGRFDLKVGDQVVKAAAGDGGQGTADVAPGTYGVSETGPDGYDSAIACRKNGQPYTSGAGPSLGGLDVDSDDAVVCTITNVRLGSVTVTKTEGGENPDGTWTFRLTGGPDAVSITKETAADGTLAFGRLKPGDYRLCEIDLPTGWHSSLGPVVGGEACVDLEIEPGEAEAVAVDNTSPAVLVIKEGDAFVHHGDTITYTFDVSNGGNTPLKDVSVEDDRCDAAPVRDAAHDVGDDGDALLETGEVWRFTCARAAASDHDGAEENPIVNVATAHAFDQAGNEVTQTDDHATTIIHPGIAVNKELRRLGDGPYRDGDAGDAPLAVHRGDTIEYRFTVTNTGDTPLTVAFSDPKCDVQPTGPDAGDMDDDSKLDTGETWIYRCSHVVTDADADPFDNTVVVTGTDRLGGEQGTVSSTDTERADIAHPDIAVDKQVRRLGQDEFVDEGLQAHVGDTLEYRFTVTDGDSDTPIAGVELTDPRCDAGTLAGPVKSGGDADELLEDGETWTYACTHVITDTDPNPLPNTATATGHDTVGCPDVEEAGDCGDVEDEDSTSVKVLNPKTMVVKTGNEFAYAGDTVTFTFAVTNAGDTPLHDVTVTDDRCAPVTGPTERRDGNADEELDPGETWMFTCAKQIPAGHKIGDENPIRNVATATGKDPLDKPVTSTDDHLVRVLHPAIDIEKTGPANAAVGAPLRYTLTVTNPGDVPFAAQDVAVADPRCEAPPAGPATGADPTPGQLDPGDAWTYTCTAQTTGQPAGTFVNTATVTAKDFNGRAVTDTDEFPTVLEAEQGVLPEEIVSGFARLYGPSGCVKQAFKATVRGRRIARVTFYVDGVKRKRIVAKSGQRVFRVKIRPGSTVGVHRVTARVVFKASSRTKARTLRLTYRRCVRQVVTPRFTG